MTQLKDMWTDISKIKKQLEDWFKEDIFNSLRKMDIETLKEILENKEMMKNVIKTANDTIGKIKSWDIETKKLTNEELQKLEVENITHKIVDTVMFVWKFWVMPWVWYLVVTLSWLVANPAVFYWTFIWWSLIYTKYNEYKRSKYAKEIVNKLSLKVSENQSDSN